MSVLLANMENIVTGKILLTNKNSAIQEMMTTFQFPTKRKMALNKMVTITGLNVNMVRLAIDKIHNTREISSIPSHHLQMVR